MEFTTTVYSERCDFIKNFSLLLPKLNIFVSLIHLVFYLLMYTDLEFFGEPFVVVFVWSTPFVGAVALFFIIRTVIIAFKNKKLPNSFEYIASYLFTVIFLCVTGWFVYDFLDAWFMF